MIVTSVNLTSSFCIEILKLVQLINSSHGMIDLICTLSECH